MNSLERLRATRMVARLVDSPSGADDPYIAHEVAALMRARPDAVYLLMQRALSLEASLEQAQAGGGRQGPH